MSSNAIGEIPVLITGDFSALADAIQQAQQASESGAQAIRQAFDIPDVGQAAAESLAALGDAAQATGADAASAAGDLGIASDAAEGLSSASDAAAGATSTLSDAAASAGESSATLGSEAGGAAGSVVELGDAGGDASGKMEGLGESLLQIAELMGVGLGIAEAVTSLKELATESINAAGKLQMAQAALTSLTGSATLATDILDKMRMLAAQSDFSFPQLAEGAQRMAALGVSAEEIPTAMQAVAAAAEATGKPLAAVTESLDRLYLSATVQPRTLAQLGISLQNIADVSGISADKVSASFKQMGGGSEEVIDTLVNAMQAKFLPAFTAMQDTIPVEINSVKVAWDTLMEDLGTAVAPDVTLALEAIRSLLVPLGEVAVKLAEIAGADLSLLISSFESLGSAISFAVGPLNQLSAAFGSINFSALGADIVNNVTHWRDMATAITLVTLGFDKITGNTAGVQAALQRLNDINSQLANSSNANLDALNKQIPLYLQTSEAAAKVTVSHQQLEAELKSEISTYADLATNGVASHVAIAAAMDKVTETAKQLGDAHKNLTAEIQDAVEAAKEHKKIIDEVGPSMVTLAAQLDAVRQKQLDAAAAFRDGAEVYREAGDQGLNTADIFKKMEQNAATLGVTVSDLNARVGDFPIVSQQARQATDELYQGILTVTDEAKQMDDAFSSVGRNLADPVAAAIQGINDSLNTVNQTMSVSLRAYVRMASDGVSSAEQIEAAFKALESSAKAAGESTMDLANTIAVASDDMSGLPLRTWDSVKAVDALGQSFIQTKTHGLDMAQQIGQSIERDLSKAISDLVLGVGNIGQAFTKLGQDVLDIVLNHIIKEALTPLLGMLDGVLSKMGGIFGGIFGSATSAAGGAATSAAGSAAGAGASAAGGAASAGGAVASGLMGSVLGFAGLGVSIASGIVSGIQNAHMENLLGKIEESTRRMDIATEQQPESILWSVENIQGNTLGIWQHMGILEALIGRAAQADEYILGQVSLVIAPALYAIEGYLQSLDGPNAQHQAQIDAVQRLQDAVTKDQSAIADINSRTAASVAGVQDDTSTARAQLIDIRRGAEQALETAQAQLAADQAALAKAEAAANAPSPTETLLGKIEENTRYVLGQITQVEVPLLARIVNATESTFSELVGEIAPGIRNLALDLQYGGGGKSTTLSVPSAPAALPDNVSNALLQMSSPLSTVLGSIDTTVLTLEQMLTGAGVGGSGATTLNAPITFNGPVVGGQSGIQDLVDMVGNALIDKLKQAGLKLQ